MKNIFIALCLICSGIVAAQDCQYALKVTNEDGSEVKLTQEKTVYLATTPIQTDLVHFSLYVENNIPLVLFSYVRDSKNFPPSICIDKNSRLSFQLANGKIVSLRQAGEESCGFIDNLEGLEKSNHTVESFFYLSPDAIEQLKSSKITMMGLRTATDKQDFVIASELQLTEDGEIYEPGNFFIENLDCIL